MSSLAIQAIEPDLICANHRLAALDAAERVRWGLTHLPGPHVLTSSFGAQSAVMLHLVTREQPDIPVVLVDTGYLFPETYRFVDALTDRLKLNLHVCRPAYSAAWLEARHGRLWERGREGLEHYNRISKIEPLKRAFEELGVGTWFAGLRREQSSSRRDLAYLANQSGRYKLLPILDWSARQVYAYLRTHALPYHPLWEQGYVSIGDWHTTQSLADVDDPSELRFHGIKRECGIHEEL